VLATGWQTVAPALLVPGAGARAYLVQDHEPDFYGASAESLWARSTYSRGLHCIAASAWLAELLRERYGASASHFDLAIDHALYGVRDTPRRANRVIFYTRPVTARRAVPLGLLALEELARRRPEVEVVLYGDVQAPALAFPHVHMGVLTWQRLAALYVEATVGMVLSLTNPSLVGLASDSMLASFGRDGPLTLTEADPLALAGAIERLLDDAPLRGRLGAAGIELVARRSWERAAEQVEDGLRIALAKPPS
jgi:glycosyltransferase involved in cell wall biosynthesis